MKLFRCTNVLNEHEKEQIHETVMRYLSEVGIRVTHERMRADFEKAGYEVEDGNDWIRFPRELVDEMISAQRQKKQAGEPEPDIKPFEVRAGGYAAFYLDPETEKVIPHTCETVSKCLRVADALPVITKTSLMGLPVDIPQILQPLYNKMLGWKYTNKDNHMADIHDEEAFPYYMQICEKYCEATGTPIERQAVATYYTSHPYAIDDKKAALYYAARDFGLTTSIGFGFIVQGLYGPATVAGSLVAAIILSFITNLVRYGLSHDRADFRIDSIRGICGVADMRSATVVKSRPEVLLGALAANDMAEFYGTAPSIPAQFQGQGKEINGYQIGAEKGMDILNILVGTHSVGSIGGISQPEHILSPIQLVLDCELVSAFNRFARGFEINEDTLGLEVFKECAPQGIFLNSMHTAQVFRQELWEPDIFTGGISYQSWEPRQEEFGFEKAKKKALDILANHHPNYLGDELEGEIKKIIEDATRALV